MKKTKKVVRRTTRKPVKRTLRKSVKGKSTRMTIKPSVKQKFREGDFVYSPSNPTEKRQIIDVKELKTGAKGFFYKLVLCDTKGRPRKSPWISEKSLSKRKK